MPGPGNWTGPGPQEFGGGGTSGFSGGGGTSGFSGFSGFSSAVGGTSGFSGFSATGTSGFSGFSASSTGFALLAGGNAFTGAQTLAVGATTSAATDLLINPTTKASGNFIDAQVNSVSKFAVQSTGNIVPTGNVIFTTAGTGLKNAGNNTIIVDSTNVIIIGNSSTTAITALTRSFVLGVTAPATIGAAPTHGQVFSILQAEELLTIAAAPTTTTTMQVPAGAILMAVPVRVTTAIPTAATFTVSCNGISFNTVAVPVALNTTDQGTNANIATVLTHPYIATASGIVITPNLTPGAATGVVRVSVMYMSVTPPTS